MWEITVSNSRAKPCETWFTSKSAVSLGQALLKRQAETMLEDDGNISESKNIARDCEPSPWRRRRPMPRSCNRFTRGNQPLLCRSERYR
jgi:hypothetical protein